MGMDGTGATHGLHASCSRSDRHPWMALDVPDLATDQKGAQQQGGAAAPDPAAYGLSPPLFQPLTAYAARGRIYPAPARGGPHPRVWAISGPLDPVTSGSPRSSPDTSASRSGCIEAWTVQIPKLTVAVASEPRWEP